MALATYSDLLASVANWMNRTDLTAVIPDFVVMAESEIGRDLRLRKQVTSTVLPTVANTRGITLPSDWLEFENVSVLNTPERQLTFATVEHLDSVYPNNGSNGVPALYTVEGDQVLFGPTPDANYSISVLYYARFPALASASANWLMTNHPAVYLYGALYQGCLFVKDKQGASEYKGLYAAAVNALQMQDDRAQHSGSSLRVRRI